MTLATETPTRRFVRSMTTVQSTVRIEPSTHEHAGLRSRACHRSQSPSSGNSRRGSQPDARSRSPGTSSKRIPTTPSCKSDTARPSCWKRKPGSFFGPSCAPTDAHRRRSTKSSVASPSEPTPANCRGSAGDVFHQPQTTSSSARLSPSTPSASMLASVACQVSTPVRRPSITSGSGSLDDQPGMTALASNGPA